MEATTTERLRFVRIVENGRRAVLEIPSNSAGELVTEDVLLGLVRDRGVAIEASHSDREEGLANARKALAIDPAAVEPRGFLASIFLEDGAHDEAERQLVHGRRRLAATGQAPAAPSPSVAEEPSSAKESRAAR